MTNDKTCYILMAIGFKKYQEKMRENVEKENSRRFPAQL